MPFVRWPAAIHEACIYVSSEQRGIKHRRLRRGSGQLTCGLLVYCCCYYLNVYRMNYADALLPLAMLYYTASFFTTDSMVHRACCRRLSFGSRMSHDRGLAAAERDRRDGLSVCCVMKHRKAAVTCARNTTTDTVTVCFSIAMA